jgi:hypothetical protein
VLAHDAVARTYVIIGAMQVDVWMRLPHVDFWRCRWNSSSAASVFEVRRKSDADSCSRRRPLVRHFASHRIVASVGVPYADPRPRPCDDGVDNVLTISCHQSHTRVAFRSQFRSRCASFKGYCNCDFSSATRSALFKHANAIRSTSEVFVICKMSPIIYRLQ